jgi:hypothetical protein
VPSSAIKMSSPFHMLSIALSASILDARSMYRRCILLNSIAFSIAASRDRLAAHGVLIILLTWAARPRRFFRRSRVRTVANLQTKPHVIGQQRARAEPSRGRVWRRLVGCISRSESAIASREILSLSLSLSFSLANREDIENGEHRAARRRAGRGVARGSGQGSSARKNQPRGRGEIG